MPSLTPAINQTLAHCRNELQNIRSGRANPAMLETIMVDAYGSSLRLVELAAITTPEARQFLVQPWDRTTLKDIERALRAAPLGLNPIVDGERIRITLPALTEERRKEYLRLANDKVEQAKITLRTIRDERLRELRDAQRSGDLSEDAADRERKSVEEAIKKATEALQTELASKEAELMTV